VLSSVIEGCGIIKAMTNDGWVTGEDHDDVRVEDWADQWENERTRCKREYCSEINHEPEGEKDG